MPIINVIISVYLLYWSILYMLNILSNILKTKIQMVFVKRDREERERECSHASLFVCVCVAYFVHI